MDTAEVITLLFLGGSFLLALLTYMNNQLPMPMLGSGILCTEVQTRM